MPPEPMIAEVAALAVVAGTLGAAVLAPPFLLFRSLARERRRSHRTGALRQRGETRP